MELYEPVEVFDVTMAVNTDSPAPNLTSLPSMFAPAMFKPTSCGGGVVSAQSQTTKPTTKSATMTINNTQPARGLCVMWPNVIISDAGSTAIASIPRKFVNGVGFA
jgi:hypothetical protein